MIHSKLNANNKPTEKKIKKDRKEKIKISCNDLCFQYFEKQAD